MKAKKLCSVLVPIGAIGGGISTEDFEYGITLKPDVIACDAGSTDSGPYYLGKGKSKYAREAVKEDLRLMMIGADKLKIPVVIGTAGTCGVDDKVDWMKEICMEICMENSITPKIATIYSQQNPDLIKRKFREGFVRQLQSAPEISEQTFDDCSNIVALAGAEPFIQALENKADIIICGRATDTAVLACMPLMKGCDPAAAWHAAKTAECGALCTTKPEKGGVFFSVDHEGFSIRPMSNESECTPYTVSAHMLYENADPYRLIEPSGTINTLHSRYVQQDEKTVRVTDTEFIPAEQYTMKLEGAGPNGYQTINLIGIQDPKILSNLGLWKDNLSNHVRKQLDYLGFSTEEYSYDFKMYGFNAVSGSPIADGEYIPKEVGILFTVTGQTQEIATSIAKIFNPYLLHFPLDRNEQLPSFAFPFSPAEIEKGKIYEFKLNHIVQVDDPLELIRIEYTNTMELENRREKS